MLARDLMTSPVISVTPQTTLHNLGEILKRERISGVPVIEESGGGILGVVTLTDVLHVLGQVYHWTDEIGVDLPGKLTDLFRKEKASMQVKDIMTPGVITVDENEPIRVVVQLMFDRKVHTIPITRDGKLVGVIGKRDIFYALIPDEK